MLCPCQICDLLIIFKSFEKQNIFQSISSLENKKEAQTDSKQVEGSLLIRVLMNKRLQMRPTESIHDSWSCSWSCEVWPCWRGPRRCHGQAGKSEVGSDTSAPPLGCERFWTVSPRQSSGACVGAPGSDCKGWQQK